MYEVQEREYQEALRSALERARRTKSPVYVYHLGNGIYAQGNWNDHSAQLTTAAVVLPNAITLERK